MSEPSDWPLSDQAIRVRVPLVIEQALSKHVLSSQIYATAVGYYPKAELHKMKRSDHDDYILIYCVDGLGYLQTNGFDGEISPGELFVLPPGTPHQYSSSIDQPWTVFWFHFRGGLASSYFEHLFEGANKPVLNMHGPQMQGRFRELIEVAKTSYSTDSYIYLNSLLSHVLVAAARSVRRESRSGMGLDINFIQDYMRKNIDKPLYLEDLASLVNVSKYHFSRKYLELTGMTPLQHFSRIKMEHACILLEQTNLSISDIGYQLGYDDALYFSRVFKKQIKLSPRAYRKSLVLR